MIQLTGLTKSYGDIQALKGVSLTVEKGEIFGLLGPNGAGKSTTMNILSGYLDADGGSVTIDGHRISAKEQTARRQLGLVPQQIALYEDLNALENLAIFGSLYQLSRTEIRERGEALLRAVELWERRKDAVKNFSGGMQRRLNLAASLLHQPDYLLCDEPTVGVDPQSRNAIFDFLEARNADGLTIIYTTHYMEEAQRLCDRVGIIDHGEIIAQGTQDDLLARLQSAPEVRLTRLPGAEQVAQAAQNWGEVTPLDESGWRLTLRPEAQLSALYAAAEQAGLPYHAIVPTPPTLEEVFLHLTGRSLRD